MIKRLFLLAAVIMLLSACKPEPRTGEFTIDLNRASVKLTVANGKWVPSAEHSDGLDDVERGLWLNVSSYDTAIDDSRFEFLAQGYVDSAEDIQTLNNKRYFFMENEYTGEVGIMMQFPDDTSFTVYFGSSNDEDLKPYYDEFLTIVSTMSLK